MKPLTKWISEQLEELTVGNYFIIPKEQLGQDKRIERLIRSQVSRTNRFANLNIKVHKDAVGLWVWNSPLKPTTQPKTNVSQTFERVISLKREYKHLMDTGQGLEASKLLSELMNAVDALQPTINTPKHTKKGSIKQSLETVLNFYGIPKTLWDLLPPREQTRQWIKAEIEINKARKQATDQTTKAIKWP